MRKVKKAKKPQRNKLLIIGAIVVIIAIIIALVLYLQPKEYKNGKEYHQHNLQALYDAESSTKQIAHNIHFSGNKIADEGQDFGCDISEGPGFSWNHNVVGCSYHYYVYFLGSGNPQKDVANLYKQIILAGWDDRGGIDGDANRERYVTYQKDSSYIWAFPIGFQKPNTIQNIPYIDLSLNMINRINNVYPSPFEGLEYHKLMNKYVYGTNNKNAYIYGYELLDNYFNADCFDCEVGLMYPDQYE